MPAQALSMTPPSLVSGTSPSEDSADSSLRSDFSSPISISGRSLQRDRGAIPREPSVGQPSQAILGPHGRHPEYVLNDTDKGRENLLYYLVGDTRTVVRHGDAMPIA